MSSLELSLARRFLFSKKRGRFLSAAALIAVTGLAFAVGALWVAFSVIAGFQKEYRQAILGINAHVILTKADEISDAATLAADLKGYEKLGRSDGVTPFIYREGMAVSGAQVKGIVLKGVDFDKYQKVSRLSLQRTPPAPGENPEKLPEIVLGKTLAENLSLKRGVLRVLFPQGMKPEDMGVKNVKKFFIVGTFESGLFEYDSTFAFLSLETAQSFFQTGDKVSGLEIWLSDPDRADAWASALRNRYDYPYGIMTWRELNENVFRALDVEKGVFAVILGVLVAVSALNIVGTLAMLFLERRGEVAILRAMGLGWRSIRNVFLFDGLLIGSAGIAAGLALGTAVLLFLDRWKPLSLAPEIYFVRSVPVAWSWQTLAGVAAAALAIVFAACVWTLRRVSRLNVARALLEA
ncbi:MAG TPA: ABC transporter permease [bacterium]|nr:ABC transporter permease [bacterium]